MVLRWYSTLTIRRYLMPPILNTTLLFATQLAVIGICFGSYLTAQFARVKFLVVGCEQGAACTMSVLQTRGSDAYHLRAPR